MNWLFGIAAYVVIWWLTIFAVLPWGVKPAEKGDLGHAAGAPANPRLRFKVVVTTIIATVLWLIAYAIVRLGLINPGS